MSECGEASSSVEAAIYRLSQEALANIHRHAGAKSATIRLVGRKRCLHLVILDDGVGYHPVDRSGVKSVGVGCNGYERTVHELGGRISIKRRAIQGTGLTVSLPRYKRTRLTPPIGTEFSRHGAMSAAVRTPTVPVITSQALPSTVVPEV